MNEETYITRHMEGHGLSVRRRQYERKLIAIASHDNPVLYPGDFVQYLLDQQSISSEQFDTMIGREQGYFRSDVFNTAYNDGNRPLPKFLQEVMAAFTNKPAIFWLRHSFHVNDAAGVSINTNADISEIVKRHMNDGGRQTRLAKADRILDQRLHGLESHKR